MNVKRISLIVLFTLFLILSVSSVYALDNSTELNSQSPDDDFNIDDIDNCANSILNNSHQWILDENGNIVTTPFNSSVGCNHFNITVSQGNFTDLRNKNQCINLSDIIQSANYSQISSPSMYSKLPDEFIKDPQSFFEKYYPWADVSSINWDNYKKNIDSCNTYYSKQFLDFMESVKQISVKPNIIESNDIDVFYSKNNEYKVRILNPIGTSVGKDINVTFIFNGKKINVKTDENGYASFRFNEQPGNYVLETYSGDITSKNKINVKQLFKTNDVKKTFKKSSKFTVKLIKQNGKSISKQIVKITFKGKNYNIKTNSKGIATFNIPKNLKIGKYVIRTAYNGCIVKNKITVVK